MGEPSDLWRDLTRTVFELIRDLKAENDQSTPAEIADAALSAFPDVPDIEQYRARLESLVRDLLDDGN